MQNSSYFRHQQRIRLSTVNRSNGPIPFFFPEKIAANFSQKKVQNKNIHRIRDVFTDLSAPMFLLESQN